jgi:hypothetical protein
VAGVAGVSLLIPGYLLTVPRKADVKLWVVYGIETFASLFVRGLIFIMCFILGGILYSRIMAFLPNV